MLTPMLATEVEASTLVDYFNASSWVLEQKLDGHRLLLVAPGMDAPPSAITRNGTPYTRRLPKGVSAFRFPPGHKQGEIVFDGELVGDTFWVFDVLGVAEQLNLNQRRKFLEQIFDIPYYKQQFGQSFKLVPRATTAEQKIALAEAAIKSNFEGLMVKHTHSPYIQGGRTQDWRKIKFVRTVDVFVTGVRTDGKNSVDLGLLTDPTSRGIVDVGRASLIGKEKNGTISVGDVLEVRFLYVNEKNRRLYQPTILRKRTDKFMHECLMEQLDAHVTNKSVLETL